MADWTLLSLVIGFFSIFSSVIFVGWLFSLFVTSFVTLVISVVFVIRYHRSKKCRPELSEIQAELIKSEVIKLLPIDVSLGWELEGMHNGVRMFGRRFTLLPNSYSEKVFACTTLVESSPKDALQSSLALNNISSWFGNIHGPVQKANRPVSSISKHLPAGDSDVISFSIQKPDTPSYRLYNYVFNFIAKAFSISMTTHEDIQRTWNTVNRKQCHLFFCPLNPSSISYSWCLFNYSAVPGHQDITMVTVVASPLSDFQATQWLISSQLCGLRDHILMTEMLSISSKGGKMQLRFKEEDSMSIRDTPSPETPLEKPSSPLTPHESPPSSLGPDARYLDIGRKCAQNMLTATNATESDGWATVGNSKGVFVMKKLPLKDEPPINCVKGTMKIYAPPDFILRVLMDPVHNRTLDDMLKDLTIIVEITPTIQLVHLTYKAIWPTSARDFAVCNIVGRLNQHVRVHTACSIVDARIPEIKGNVRAEVLTGGYCIKDVPGNENCSEVTYITQVDLKGNVPTFVVNKVIDSQPQCVNLLNKIVIKEYARLSVNKVLLNEYEAKYPIYDVFPVEKVHEHVLNEVPVLLDNNDSITEDSATAKRTSLESDDDRNEANNSPTVSDTFPTTNGQALDNDDTPPDDSIFETTINPMSSVLQKLPRYKSDDGPVHDRISLNQHSLLSSGSFLDFPRSDGLLDFKTHSNQISAKVLEELFNISGLDIMDPLTYGDKQGGWKFQGIEKDVAILKKKMPNSPFHCFIGRGLIQLAPQEVYNCVRNPTQRYIYDNMLKELHFVKQIEEGMYVLHLHHESKQCFMKQSRDFCVLVCERTELNKKLIVGSSVDIPECPPQIDISRGRILNSGWVIEPYRRLKTLCTQVTYMVQIDVGGVPANIVNFISRRQPLAVAYIREFLESTSLNFKENPLLHKVESEEEEGSPIAPPRFRF